MASPTAASAGPWKVCASLGCPHVGQPQPWEAFYHLRGYRGRQYCGAYCKPCHSEWQKAYRDTPEVKRARAKAERKRRARQRRAALKRDRWLPLAPFADWLHEHLPPSGEVTQEAAAAVGMDRRTMYRLLKGGQLRVRLSTVDKAVTRWGDPGLLGMLYPEE